MRRLIVLLILALLVLVPASAAQAHRLGSKQAVIRARVIASDIEQRSSVLTSWVVIGCTTTGSTGHRMDCGARLRGQSVLCRVRIRVRFKSSRSTERATVASVDNLDCRQD